MSIPCKFERSILSYDEHEVILRSHHPEIYDTGLDDLIDRYLYYSGRVDTSLPFDELRRRSLINEAAHAADGAPDFSERIRASLPTGSDHARPLK